MLDGLDQLSDGKATNAAWLPPSLPPNCSLLIGTNRTAAFDATAERRGWIDAATVRA